MEIKRLNLKYMSFKLLFFIFINAILYFILNMAEGNGKMGKPIDFTLIHYLIYLTMFIFFIIFISSLINDFNKYIIINHDFILFTKNKKVIHELDIKKLIKIEYIKEKQVKIINYLDKENNIISVKKEYYFSSYYLCSLENNELIKINSSECTNKQLKKIQEHLNHSFLLEIDKPIHFVLNEKIEKYL